MEPVPIHFSLVDTLADDTLFEGHTWGWYCIDHCAVVAQNQNELSLKKLAGSPTAFPTLTYSYTVSLSNG